MHPGGGAWMSCDADAHPDPLHADRAVPSCLGPGDRKLAGQMLPVVMDGEAAGRLRRERNRGQAGAEGRRLPQERRRRDPLGRPEPRHHGGRAAARPRLRDGQRAMRLVEGGRRRDGARQEHFDVPSLTKEEKLYLMLHVNRISERVMSCG